VQQGQADSTGVTVRGGANLTTGQGAHSVTLLRGHAQLGGPCGSFDFGSSLKQAFDEIPTLIESLAQQLISQAPMLALCYASPTVCDIAKHFQALVNAAVQARFAQCQSAQNAAMYTGLRLRAGEVSRCLEDHATAGDSISEALKTCNSDPGSLRSPDGTQKPQVNLVEDTLAAAGATTETQTLAKSLLGEVTLQAGNGPMRAQSDRPQAALLARYEAHKAEAESALRLAVDELHQTGQVSDTTLRAVSVPGQPLPRAALDALVALHQDQTRYESLLGKLSTGMALTRLTWDCHELQDQLAAATEGNAHLSEEERRILEKRSEALQLTLLQVMEKAEVQENHLAPAVDALLREYTNV